MPVQRDSDLSIDARIITETKFETIICDNFKHVFLKTRGLPRAFLLDVKKSGIQE